MRVALGVTKLPTEDWRDGVSEALLCEFWLAATRVPFSMGDEYSNKLTHPCLRLIHKVMMGAFSGHKEDNKVHSRVCNGFIVFYHKLRLSLTG